MIRVSVEVISGGASVRLAIWAESIDRAIRQAGGRYPGCETRVLFPIDPEVFFAKDDAATDQTVVVEAHEEVAGGTRAG
jgi:hypothetical protein